MIAWPDVEAALQGRPGWRRGGREYHGPCPVSGAGRDCCFASEGRAGDVALGCRKCGDLESESFLAHLAALVGETARHVAAHATNDRAARAATPSPLPARAWRAEASLGMQSRGWQETHRHPQKTNPAPPPGPPLTHRVGADCKVREVRAGGPRPLMPSRASARRPIYLYWFSANLRPPVFAVRFRPSETPVPGPPRKTESVPRCAVMLYCCSAGSSA